jgi:hypothetical protein
VSGAGKQSGSRRSNRVLSRARAAGAGLCVAVLAVTGVFVTKIEKSYAASHTGSTGFSGSTGTTGAGSTAPAQSGFSGAPQLTPAPDTPAPQAGSHGS